MGRVRTKTVKKSSRQVIERYYSRMTLDFHTNKKVLEEVALIPSKRLRNKIAGFSTHLMKRIQKGPVRGISLKLQEEERERRMDFVPDVSAIRTEQIEVDKETLDMLAALGMSEIPGVVQVDPVPVQQIPFGRGGAGRRAMGLDSGTVLEEGILQGMVATGEMNGREVELAVLVQLFLPSIGTKFMGACSGLAMPCCTRDVLNVNAMVEFLENDLIGELGGTLVLERSHGRGLGNDLIVEYIGWNRDA
ncbi:Ribosomal protein S17e [Sesbania bispinosa]|nr:Ribosomal protein S17e [Sesbania bispinosa]